MTITEVKGLQEFRDILENHPTVLVDFWAPWLSGNTPNIYFVKVNVDEAEDISQEYGIRAMPTFILFKDGEKVNEVVGADPGKVEQLVQSA
ncbi:thioredoxin-like protein [Fusarium acuminatum]|uniref:Thioredoxin-like protein n=1 Tax=Fusarium acuminatum TaxID=5515 RepID=A0ABZ2WQB2_9HYPO